MQNTTLSGFYAGIVTSITGSPEVIEQKRKQWTQEGRICWINKKSLSDNQQSPGDE